MRDHLVWKQREFDTPFDALRGVMLEGRGVVTLWSELVLLAVWGTISFLIEIEVPITEGAGERVLIASSPDEVAASAEVLVLRPPSKMPGVPGFGLG